MVAGRQPPTSPPQSYATVVMSPLTSTTPRGPKPRPYRHHNRTLHAYQTDNAAAGCAQQRSYGACATTQLQGVCDNAAAGHAQQRSCRACATTQLWGVRENAAAGRARQRSHAAGGIGGGDGDGGRDSERGDGDGDGDAGSGDADMDGDNGDRVAMVVMRASTSTLMQVVTDHAFTGTYVQRFRTNDPPENISCPCGAEVRDSNHITHECPRFVQARLDCGILSTRPFHPQPLIPFEELLGSRKGAKMLLDFFDQTRALSKPETGPPLPVPPEPD
ncbi:hypothetical protein EDB83DRAFT_2521592 [Lactarius deliciosus]|nr:hypothetical protein EDB83DRAFT_2521592 [Lactarius deliciosus]